MISEMQVHMDIHVAKKSLCILVMHKDTYSRKESHLPHGLFAVKTQKEEE